MKIVAVVVTYNRKKLLSECLTSLINQSFMIDKIIVIDNNSSDNSFEYLIEEKILPSENIEYIKLSSNIGGAGGFYEGIKKSMDYNPDWVWIMDDDTIPNSDSLKYLVKSVEIVNKENVSFFASAVFGEKNEYMNVPTIDLKHDVNGYSSWYQFLDNGMVRIKDATFVSLLINADAIKNVGLPVKDYFIWGDDTEYTLRLTRYYGNAYFVGKSKVIHKRKIAKSISLVDEENINRLTFHFYMIRNSLFNLSTYYGLKVFLKYLLKCILISLVCLLKPNVKYRIKKFIIVYKGIFSYIFKRIDYNAFKNRFDINVVYK